MREEEFKKWLSRKGNSESSISSRISNARRLEQHYGDLDELSRDQGLENLLQKLSYTTEDQRDGKPNPVTFPIDGDLYNNLASYKAALTLYQNFLKHENATPQPNALQLALDLLNKEHIEEIMDECDSIGVDGFLTTYQYSPSVYQVVRSINGKLYPAKAIVGVALKKLPEGRALPAREFFNGFGDAEARNTLKRLEYEIVKFYGQGDDKAGLKEGHDTNKTLTYNPTNHPTNLILYGPPGTGKTYHTAFEAVRLCDGSAPEDRAALQDRYQALMREKRIDFVTFHQSYDYETFVEGLRPETQGGEVPGNVSQETNSGSGGFRLEVKSGIFRDICALADQTRLAPKDKSDAAEIDLSARRFWKMGQGAVGSEDDVYEAALAGDYIALGWGGDIDWSDAQFSTAEAIRKEWQNRYPEDKTPSNWTQTHVFRSVIRPGDIVIVPYGNSAFRAVAEITGDYYFEPSAEGHYAHRRKVKWLLILDEPLPLDLIIDGNFTMRTLYSIQTRRINMPALARLLKPHETQSHAGDDGVAPEQFVFIIDEINRANISKVFGELITLIEFDKRLGMPNATTARLPYSKREFGVPANLHIIGTMNTADRSIALLDTALRRRFQFKEMLPDHDCLPEDVDGVPLRDVLRIMNERIEYLFDREHCIGHAFFLGAGCNSRAGIDAVMRYKVIPLLQEYFFEDWARVAAVLGEKQDQEGAFLNCRKLNDPTGENGEERKSWRVRDVFAPDAYEQLIRQISST